MKLAIVDPTRAYAPDAPWTGPLGGTQSAACYLAQALAAQGCTVDLYNHIAEPVTAHGVTAQNWQPLFDGNAAHAYDALILNGRWTSDMVDMLTQSGRPVIGWMHEAAFNPDWIVPSAKLTGIVFVSHWQQRVNRAELPVGVRSTVIENAISPHVEAVLRDPPAKDPNRVIYCGDVERGLRYLPAIWPTLHAANPQLRLEIFAPRLDNALSAALQALPGLDHYGLVDQRTLASRMAQATWHLSPNPYPETSCISLIEALALGCHSIVTACAALPETANGFATLVPVTGVESKAALASVDLALFTQIALETLATSPSDRSQQVQFFADWRWNVRATQWRTWLANLLTGL